VIGVGHEAQRQREPGEHQRPGVQVGDRTAAGEADPGHPVVEVLAVGGVDRTAVLQALEHHEGRVQERDGEQDQRQHEGDHHGRLDGRLDGHHAHQQAEQVGAAIAHEARRRREVVQQEPECRAGGDRRQHAGGGAIEIEGDDRKRPGDDHAHSRSQAVDAVGEVDDVHHHHQPDHRQQRAGVGRAGFGEVQCAGEGQRDRLHGDAVVHDDHRRGDLTGELDQRRQVEAVVERADDRDDGGGDQHAAPKIRAFAVAGGQECQHRDHHSGEDRKAAEQRRGTVGETALARFVHCTDSPGQPHRQRRQQRRHGGGDQERVQRVDLFQMRHLSSDSIARREALRAFRPAHAPVADPYMYGSGRGRTCAAPWDGTCAVPHLGACAEVNYKAARALSCSYSG
jgi:hypothetical protein